MDANPYESPRSPTTLTSHSTNDVSTLGRYLRLLAGVYFYLAASCFVTVLLCEMSLPIFRFYSPIRPVSEFVGLLSVITSSLLFPPGIVLMLLCAWFRRDKVVLVLISILLLMVAMLPATVSYR